MSKLYPPELEGTLPAFTKVTSVEIPFVRNKTISHNNGVITKMKLLIKNIYGTRIFGAFESIALDFEENTALFNLNSIRSQLSIGQFYKVQIAYVGQNDEVGYYSNVGVIKYTSLPTLTLNLNSEEYNLPKVDYIGTYTNNEDPTEKAYSYQFIIKDNNNIIIADSKINIHNHDNNTEIFQSQDHFTCHKLLEFNKIYSIEYIVTTVNGVVAKSPKYLLQKIETEPLISAFAIEVSLNEENAYSSLCIVYDETYKEEIAGNFIITRASSKDNYENWYEISRVHLNNGSIGSGSEIFRDYTIEFGYEYQYGLQQYNSYGYTTNIEPTKPLVALFEHSFLYDGERQLKIKYNPKLSGYKTVIQETKVQGLGAKYPSIVRNGSISYKEFTIQGLISYLSDEENLFMSINELYSESFQEVQGEQRENAQVVEKSYIRSTSLTDNNILTEKVFRDKVFEFLNNGKPKIFKSPTEGNLIIYTMNNSLTPEEAVGRMLYNFSATASEIMEYNWDNLLKYQFIDIVEPNVNKWYWKSLPTYGIHQIMQSTKLASKLEKMITTIDGKQFFNITIDSGIYGIDITEAKPGTCYIIGDEMIHVGVSGQYQVELKKPIKYIGVEISPYSGWLIIRYTRDLFNEFNVQKGLTVNKLPKIQQFIGKRNILEELDNSWEELSAITYFKFSRRPIITLYVDREKLEQVDDKIKFKKGQEKYYIDNKLLKEFSKKDFSPSFIYEIKSVSLNFALGDNLVSINDIESTQIKKAYFSPLLEKIEFYIDTAQKNRFFPRKHYILQRVEQDWHYNKRSKFYLKFTFQDEWIYEDFSLSKNDFDAIKKIPDLELFQKNIIRNQNYIERLDINLEDWSSGTFYCWDEEKNDYVLDESSAYDINKIYLVKGITEQDIIYYSKSTYSDYYWYEDKDKIFIKPEQFNFQVLLGINDQDGTSTKDKMVIETLNLENDLILSGNNFKNILQLDIGWGISCEIVYNLRKRIYGFSGLEPPEENPYGDNDILQDYIDYVNWLNDKIYFYRLGDGGGV